MAVTFLQLGNFGRFGNCLFQIAAVIGHAKKCNTNFFFPLWGNFQYFTYDFVQSTDKHSYFDTFTEKTFHYTDIPNKKDIDLRGYFQSMRYWENCEDFIREVFKPSGVIEAQINKEYNSLLEGDTCAIHIRRGDYLNLTHYHYNQSLDYYKKAMDLMGDKKFIIFSDDIDWCKKNIKGCEYIDTGNECLDFFIATKCKNFIIVNYILQK